MYDVIVFENFRFHPSSRNEKPAFSKIFTLESVFEKICFQWLFSLNRLGQTGEKNFHLQTKTVTCGKGLLNFNNNLNN